MVHIRTKWLDGDVDSRLTKKAITLYDDIIKGQNQMPE